MSIILIDGFDHMDAVDVWTVVGGNTAHASPTVNVRTGTRSMGMGINSLMSLALGPSEQDDGVTMGAAMWCGSNATDGTRAGGLMFMEDVSTGTVVHLNVIMHAPTRSLRIYRGNFAGTVTLLASTDPNLFTLNAWHYVEAQVKIANSGGYCEVRYDGVTVLTYSGDTRDAHAFETGIINRMGIIGNGFSAQTCIFDDVYMLNEQGSAPWNSFLGDTRCYPLYPIGNGFYSQLDGSDGNNTDNYQLVDEVGVPILTDYVGSITAGEKDTYEFEDITDFQSLGTIAAVESRIHAAKTETGTKQMRLVVRRGGADAFGPDHILAQDNFSTHRYIMEQDPHAGPGAWTLGNVDATEFGVEVRS